MHAVNMHSTHAGSSFFMDQASLLHLFHQYRTGCTLICTFLQDVHYARPSDDQAFVIMLLVSTQNWWKHGGLPDSTKVQKMFNRTGSSGS